MNPDDLSWAFIRGYYFSRFLMVVKNMEWDERYEFLRAIYDDKHPDAKWEERSDDPIQDMMEYVGRKDYFHFFCMGFTVFEDGRYIVHEKIRDLMARFNRGTLR